jgi:multicomponent Na+:H+ antiporter subunit F
MSSFMIGAAIFIIVSVAVGLVRILRGPAALDRMMAVQLLGSGGIAALLLISVAMDAPALLDVAVSIALLAAFASVALIAASEGAALTKGEKR